MGEFNLNLSTRPFPAYRVANLALILFFFVVAGVSVWQVYSFQYYSARAKTIRAEEKSARELKGTLEGNLNELSARLDRPATAAKLAEVEFLNNLIVRKHFSWTEVFSNLEGVVPDGVRLENVAPEISKDKVSLHLEVVCRSTSDEGELIRRLQASPVFQDVVVSREETKGTAGANDVGVSLIVSYFPERAAQ